MRTTVAAVAALLVSMMVPAAAVGSAGPVVGRAAPDFALTTLNGRRATLRSFRGKTLVINVWGSWCPPCRLEMPDFVAEARAAAGSVAFLGVDTTETPAVARAFTAAKGVTYPQAVTTAASAFARAYDIRNFPTTVVIDPRGVVRAMHADNVLPRAQLHAYIAAAQRGASAPLVTAEQRKLDALLDLPDFSFAGDARAVAAEVRRADKAIAAADEEMDDAMSDTARDHDLVRTRAEEARLRDAAIAALTPVARDRADAVLLARLRGDRGAAHGDWLAADAAYARALALAPADRAALDGQAYAAAKRGDDARVARIDARIAALAPTYANFIAVARAEAKRGDRAAAYAALDSAVAAARATRNPKNSAWTHLYGGRAAVALGDSARARREFAQAESAAQLIPPRDSRYAMYLEQSQEAVIALGLTGARGAALSLAPWTGADLPGSVAGTMKYRLAVSGASGTRVALSARGLPKGWIGSFCSDRLCSPFASTVVVPPARVKIVEFQVVPGDFVRAQRVVKIEAAVGGKLLAAATAVVRVPQ
ncbi:MAG: TlpA family protein disulfide reductase [Candidatus Velthaea sp.]